VKYHIYYGLAYEELYKLASSQAQAQEWFSKAEAAYKDGSALNPYNGYYWGNLGRLNALAVETGRLDRLPDCEQMYFKAIERAPVTVLFYQNLMQIYARTGKGIQALGLAEDLSKREPRLAGYLYVQAAIALLQWHHQVSAAKDKDVVRRYPELADQALEIAERMRPDLAQAPYTRAVALLTMSRPLDAKAALARALAIDPNYEIALRFKTAQGW
jgi:tetratricopeptide (TPR) repeat protein